MQRLLVSTPPALFAVTALAVGCAPLNQDGQSLGELGQVAFGYDRSCFFECAIEQPLLVGTRETIQVTGPGDDEGISASTPDDDIVDLAMERDCFCERKDGNPGRLEIANDAGCAGAWRKHCDNTILVEARRAGDARLQLHDARHDLVDTVRLLVRKADRAAFFATYEDRLGTLETDALELTAGERLDLEVELYDTDGVVLLAPEGVAWSVENETLAIVSAWLIGMGKEVSAGLSVGVEAMSPGKTKVTVSVPGLDASIPLTVTQR